MGRIIRIRKEVMGCFQDVMGKMKCIILFKNGQEKWMIDGHIMVVIGKEGGSRREKRISQILNIR